MLQVCFLLLCFADTVIFFVLFKKKTSRGLWQPCVKQVFISAIFPVALAHFTPLSHILVILTIVPTISFLYLLWRLVISDVRGYYYNCFWGSMSCADLIDKCCVCYNCSTHRPSPPAPRLSLSLLRPPYSPRTNNIDIRPVNNPTLTIQVKGRLTCLSF